MSAETEDVAPLPPGTATVARKQDQVLWIGKGEMSFDNEETGSFTVKAVGTMKVVLNDKPLMGALAAGFNIVVSPDQGRGYTFTRADEEVWGLINEEDGSRSGLGWLTKWDGATDAGTKLHLEFTGENEGEKAQPDELNHNIIRVLFVPAAAPEGEATPAPAGNAQQVMDHYFHYLSGVTPEDDLSKLSQKRLKAMCRELGLSGYSNLKGDALVTCVRNALVELQKQNLPPAGPAPRPANVTEDAWQAAVDAIVRGGHANNLAGYDALTDEQIDTVLALRTLGHAGDRATKIGTLLEADKDEAAMVNAPEDEEEDE